MGATNRKGGICRKAVECIGIGDIKKTKKECATVCAPRYVELF